MQRNVCSLILWTNDILYNFTSDLCHSVQRSVNLFWPSDLKIKLFKTNFQYGKKYSLFLKPHHEMLYIHKTMILDTLSNLIICWMMQIFINHHLVISNRWFNIDMIINYAPFIFVIGGKDIGYYLNLIS